METYSLRERLKTLEDKRRRQGRRHPIDITLIIVIFATMSGYIGYRAIGDFVKRYKEELIEYLQPNKDRLPSYSTIRRVILNLDVEQFRKIFEDWVSSYFVKDGKKWVSIDGKTIKGSKEKDKKLVHLVSIFASDSKDVLMSKSVNDKSNEIPTVQEMLQEFPLKDMIITTDAIHTQKENTKIIKQSGNDYLMQVKRNQKNVRTNRV